MSMENGKEDDGRKAAIAQTWVLLQEHEAAHPGQPYATVLHLRVSQPKADISDLAQEFSAMVGAPVSPQAFRKVLQAARGKFLEIITGLGYGPP